MEDCAFPEYVCAGRSHCKKRKAIEAGGGDKKAYYDLKKTKTVGGKTYAKKIYLIFKI
jgi:hypothetical protein